MVSRTGMCRAERCNGGYVEGVGIGGGRRGREVVVLMGCRGVEVVGVERKVHGRR